MPDVEEQMVAYATVYMALDTHEAFKQPIGLTDGASSCVSRFRLFSWFKAPLAKKDE